MKDWDVKFERLLLGVLLGFLILDNCFANLNTDITFKSKICVLQIHLTKQLQGTSSITIQNGIRGNNVLKQVTTGSEHHLAKAYYILKAN